MAKTVCRIECTAARCAVRVDLCDETHLAWLGLRWTKGETQKAIAKQLEITSATLSVAFVFFILAYHERLQLGRFGKIEMGIGNSFQLIDRKRLLAEAIVSFQKCGPQDRIKNIRNRCRSLHKTAGFDPEDAFHGVTT